MIGALTGDMIGSYYERKSTKQYDFRLFNDSSRMTDDGVLTAAVAEAILEHGTPGTEEYTATLRSLGRAYPHAGYGGGFRKWLSNPRMGPYNSWGNGSAMRVSPVGWAFDSEEDVLRQAELSALPTHNHPEGVKGAQAVALSVFMARTGASKGEIRRRVSKLCGYNLDRTVEEIRPNYSFEVSCRLSVPEAIIAFLDSEDFESALRNAVSLGGDADTQAAMAGSIAEAFYGGVPEKFLAFVLPRLPGDILGISTQFARVFLPPETVEALEAETAARLPEQKNGLYDRRYRYTVLLHRKTRQQLDRYVDAMLEGTEEPGDRLKSRLEGTPKHNLTGETLLQALLYTKKPCIFAESALAGDGSDWSAKELSFLGDISIAVPVTVYDDGRHGNPRVHEEPFTATLVYTPGALLRNGRGGRPADWDVVKNGRVDRNAYTTLYERRLLPVFKYINDDAVTKSRRAFITIPGLGCGQFAGPFHGSLGTMLGNALEDILDKYTADLPGIRVVWYDPYNEGANRRHELEHISYFIRPLRANEPSLPQLCRPKDYEEGEDDFSDCDLYSIVAWDHVSWPGNDFYAGSRATDDGVKAAATDSMFALTGLRGAYNRRNNTYDPPAGYGTWGEVVEQNRLRLRATGNLRVFG